MTAEMFDPEVETRPWAEQQRLDDPLYRRQAAHLIAHSRFYSAKFATAGVRSAEDQIADALALLEAAY